MSVFRVAKVISALPGTLTPDTFYAVRTGAGFDLYMSDATGSVAHAINGGAAGSQEVFVQESRPPGLGPWMWWQTDADGNIIDLTIADGNL
jgi:hypothetical protein